jgi:hypothetical protein
VGEGGNGGKMMMTMMMTMMERIEVRQLSDNNVMAVIVMKRASLLPRGARLA